MSHENKLNQDQQQALRAIKRFLFDPSLNTFILQGYAGTGKTFLMQHLGKILKEKKKAFSFLASTGRAAAVLRGKTGFDARTVHSELYHFTNVEGDDANIASNAPIDAFGQMKLIFNLRSTDEKERLYIVDEASMLASEISADTSFAQFGTGRLLFDFFASIANNKVIFVGDPCQLPPVQQLFSPALSQKWIRAQGRSPVTAQLTDIVRNKADSGILQLAGHVRSLFTANSLPKWIKLPAYNIPDIKVVAHLTQLTKQYVDIAAKGNNTNCMAICRSNRDCMLINREVRLIKYGTDDAPLQVGDVLMVTQNNYLVALTNGDFVQVLSLGEPRTKANLHFINIRVKALMQDKEYEILICLDVLYGTQNNISQEQHRDLMVDFSRRMSRKGIRANSAQYKETMMKDAYLNSLRAVYGYAITCHKAQGGEWNEVYLFLNKGMYSMEQPELLRWWYTAITRAKEKLYLHADWWII